MTYIELDNKVTICTETSCEDVLDMIKESSNNGVGFIEIHYTLTGYQSHKEVKAYINVSKISYIR